MTRKAAEKTQEKVEAKTKNGGAKTPPAIINLTGFKVDEKLAKSARLAQLLDWCAKHFPRQILPVNLALKGIEGYAKTPRMDSKEVLSLKSKYQATRRILLNRYNRTLVTEAGIGIRASVDDDDHVEKGVLRAGKRLTSAQKALEEVSSIVNPANIKNKELRTYFNSARAVLKIAQSQDFNTKLLPPGAQPEE